MPTKTPKPMIPAAKRLKRLGFERTIKSDGTPGKISKTNFNPIEKQFVLDSLTFEELLGVRKAPLHEVFKSANEKRANARIERQDAEMIKRINQKLNAVSSNSKRYSVEDVIKNAHRVFVKIASIRRGEPISKVNTRAHFASFKEKYISELRTEYIKKVGELKTYDLDIQALSEVLFNTTIAIFDKFQIGKEVFYKRNDYIYDNILRKAKRI